ncbi:unnamed protein product [Ambrosiozyma monospora]|uniref:Unnamed protein product n=1 Tax=Ambrosiozyma monospora TaxID=43982 RepID=A0A9W7DHW1_AMBMO|nr:unnamed protein product [Ambrosiozyma monospora]
MSQIFQDSNPTSSAPGTVITPNTTSSWRQSFTDSEESAKLVRRFNDFRTVDWVEESVKENQKHYYQISKNNNNNSATTGDNSTTITPNPHGRPNLFHAGSRHQSERDLTAHDLGLETDEELDDAEFESNAAISFFHNKSSFKYWRRFIADRLKVSLQSWVTLTLIGLVIGTIAGCLNIITEWLGDFKTGYCSTNFYLNKDFCCFGEAEETCSAWQTWTEFGFFKYLAFVAFSVLFGFVAAVLCKFYAPTAAGSGISEVKIIVSGFILQSGFLGWWTLFVKAIGLPLVIASGLSVEI